ncbi:uncharacterized protein LOC124455885 [Xenia sp. Carnegie-2017]|uniref:uncharacterized protein LOC124455885 n=1 Tax=Xenia sp. Carnegie-2017 TaxID=2897299 RepID=UPI001F03CE55|nr:uncharacterized protein LOC124455885 [Xenia sp. Carnegie-2017]
MTEYPALQLVSEVKAEFGRILADENEASNMIIHYNNMVQNVMKWAGNSDNKHIKILMSEMEAMLLQKPNKEADVRSAVTALIIQDVLNEKSTANCLVFKICCEDDSFDDEIANTTYPRLIGSGELGSLDPLVIATEGQIFLNLSKKI